MGWRIALIVGLVACGRVGFDSRDGDGNGDGVADADGPTDDSDAPADEPGLCSVGGECEDNGGECMAGVCVLEPRLGSLEPAVCPDNMPCEVRCDGFAACQRGVDCAGATDCSVLCTGSGACQYGVDCGEAETCHVTCTGGMGACQLSGVTTHSVNCRDSNCEVTCSGLAACQAGITVGSGGSCVSHCCAGACMSGHGDCVNDTMCL